MSHPVGGGGVFGLVDVDVEARLDLVQGGERRVGMARVSRRSPSASMTAAKNACLLGK